MNEIPKGADVVDIVDEELPLDFDSFLLEEMARYRKMVGQCEQAPADMLAYMRAKFAGNERYDLRKMPDGIWCIVVWTDGLEHFCGVRGGGGFGKYPIVIDFNSSDGPVYSLSYKALDTIRYLADARTMTREQKRQIAMKRNLASRNWNNMRQAFIAEKKTKYRGNRIIVAR